VRALYWWLLARLQGCWFGHHHPMLITEGDRMYWRCFKCHLRTDDIVVKPPKPARPRLVKGRRTA
jgi:hypothetical protein